MSDYYDTPEGKRAIACYLASIHEPYTSPRRRKQARKMRHGTLFTVAIVIATAVLVVVAMMPQH